MPRKGTREEAAAKRQDKRLEAHHQKYSDVAPKYKHCDFCGRSIVINNYPDKKSRTPRWRKTNMVICPWCNPTTYMDTVTNPTLYKTIMSRVIVERLAAMDYCFKDGGEAHPVCKCLGCGAKKLMAIKDERLGI